jgi:translation initiation factor IF-2
LTHATPSTPVVITGFKTLPEFGDEFKVLRDEKSARLEADKVASARKAQGGTTDMSGSELIRMINRSNMLQEYNVILKADVQGSLTSVADSLRSIDTDEVATRIVGSGVGVINESDIHMAHTSGAVIYGFNVEAPSNIKRLAMRDKVSIRLYKIIYELLDDVRAELTKLLAPEIKETALGRLIVRGIFKTSKTEIICGGEVTKGKLVSPAYARVLRGDEVLAEVKITGLKRGPQEAKEVVEGEMCGMSMELTSKLDLQEGDKIELFTRETVARSL